MNEVVVIGGGVVGLCCAWHLAEAGCRVTVLDRGDFTEGCSHGNAGMIVPSHFIPLAAPGVVIKGLRWMLDSRSPLYIRPRASAGLARWLWLFARSANQRHVDAAAPMLRDLHMESREWYQSLSAQYQLAVGYQRRGILMLYRSAAAERAELEAAEMARGLGMDAVALTPTELAVREPGVRFDVRGGVHYPGDAHLSPHLLMREMHQYLSGQGVSFRSRAEVVSLEDRSAQGCAIRLADQEVLRARHVVLAAGVWSGKSALTPGRPLPMQDGKGYAVTIPVTGPAPSIPAILHEARVAITRMGDTLRIAGTLEISGLDDRIRTEKVKRIVESVSGYYPDLSIPMPDTIWYGYRPCTPDGLPYVGRRHPRSAVILAAGHAMMGVSLAPATGRMVAGMVTGQPEDPRWSIFRPDRFGA